MSEWRKTSLGELVSFKAGTGFPKELQGVSTGDLPFAKVSDMNTSGSELILCTAENYISYQQARELKAYVHKVGSIAFAKIGVALTSNRRRKITHPIVLDNNMMSAEPFSAALDFEFAYHLFRTLDFNDISAGSAIPYLTIGSLKSIAVLGSGPINLLAGP